MSKLYANELAELVEKAERTLTWKDENYPPFDVQERQSRLLCGALEHASVNNLAGAPCMTIAKTWLVDIANGKIR